MLKLIIILGLLSPILHVSGQPTVQVEQGEIQGKSVPFHDEYLGIHTDIDVYLGIPYAEPPIGQGRFSPPSPKEPWGDDEVYDATYNRDICVQFYSLEFDNFNQSEDCLHLNVYAPNPKPTDAAVMVFIHGGGYLEGNGYQGYYGGLPLSGIGGVILVTINYRLSAFGFLTTGDEALPGNYGMLDQVEALKWVKTNIQAFGGDANKITIFGESAGGSSVSSHLFSPLSSDLFEQAIIESGSALASWLFYDESSTRKKAFQLGEAVGCSASSSQELISCMREVDAQLISKTATEIVYLASPCVDNSFLLELPMESLEKNAFKKCPMINGFNNDEGTLFIYGSEIGAPYLNSSEAPFVTKETFEKELVKSLNITGGFYTNDAIEDSIHQEYVDWSKSDDPNADYFDSWKNAAGDHFLSCPATLETKYHAAVARDYDIYQYLFSHIPSISFATSEFYGQPGWLGSGHGEELAFVFGYPFDPSLHLAFHKYTDFEKELSHKIIKYWTNFAKTGNPAKESDSSTPYEDERAWPAFTIPELQYKELAVNLTEGRGLRADECHFWNEYLPKLTTFSADLAETERQWREEFYSWKYTDMEDWRDAFEKYQEVVNSP